MPKRIGILGGLSPESTVAYYQHIVRTHTARTGDHAYPEILIYSLCFEPYIQWPRERRWDLIAQGLSAAARTLESAGADFIVIATNTMHMVLREVQAAVGVPILSLLEVVGEAIRQRGITSVGLWGTRFTMEAPLYPEALAQKGIEVLRPEARDRNYVNQVIYDELIRGEFKEAARREFVEVIHRLARCGAGGVILGCTEIPLLVTEQDAGLPLFDTATLHAEAALKMAVNG